MLTMNAARYHGRRDIRIERVPVPEPAQGQVRLRVAYNGICGSDLHEYYDGPIFMPAQAHPLTGHHLPAILGHEFSGVVDKIGPGCPDGTPDVGRLVAVNPVLSCGECDHCRSHEENRCRDVAILGNAGGHGGLAEYVIITADQLIPVPDGVSAEEAAVAEPLAVAVHGVSKLSLAPVSTALVIGGGPVGLGSAMALRSAGAETIHVAELSERRRELVESLGFDLHADGAGQEYDVVVDCAGAPATLAMALGSLRAGGQILVVAMAASDIPLSITGLNVKEATLQGTHLYSTADFRVVLERFAAGEYSVDGWVETVPLRDLIDEGYEALRAGDRVKVLIDPHEGEK
ncbi:alcohol dehydrogenase catalytic domain-containing protein [Leucobacter sp. CSA1]|uniref:Alcohol dehydrogenase catalytic domain-containing protein n=1 Tax=Leucobacter chromiisoli TaxID=2796471 RepID=A0A934UTU3_9MICO|nr:alcohol dehydrogenase catalytic domain-containing protein [Leucobacter chromiisoli]MBK0418789.1 alcohol dehydrogenase catalytic domain-containing protein [Leucobacter chromiisoli]